MNIVSAQSGNTVTAGSGASLSVNGQADSVSMGSGNLSLADSSTVSLTGSANQVSLGNSDPRIAAYSLQLGPRAADIGKLGADLLVTDLSPVLPDFAETAAVLQQLDLLITIDSAVAHLAGALGVKTFLLLRKVSDWRWFDHRSDSPWYPSMTLFRQVELDQWDVPLEALQHALDGEIGILNDQSVS